MSPTTTSTDFLVTVVRNMPNTTKEHQVYFIKIKKVRAMWDYVQRFITVTVVMRINRRCFDEEANTPNFEIS